MKDLVRQGDILFRRIPHDKRPTGLQSLPGKVIQKGEVTGHAHRITEGEANILAQYEKQWGTKKLTVSNPHRFLEAVTPTTIGHEEHGPAVLAPDLWEIIQAREFDYAANLGRRVVD